MCDPKNWLLIEKQGSTAACIGRSARDTLSMPSGWYIRLVWLRLTHFIVASSTENNPEHWKMSTNAWKYPPFKISANDQFMLQYREALEILDPNLSSNLWPQFSCLAFAEVPHRSACWCGGSGCSSGLCHHSGSEQSQQVGGWIDKCNLLFECMLHTLK